MTMVWTEIACVVCWNYRMRCVLLWFAADTQKLTTAPHFHHNTYVSFGEINGFEYDFSEFVDYTPIAAGIACCWCLFFTPNASLSELNNHRKLMTLLHVQLKPSSVSCVEQKLHVIFDFVKSKPNNYTIRAVRCNRNRCRKIWNACQSDES